MPSNHKPTLLVTGASGQLGRRVVELLLEAQAGPIIATTRTPEKLADLATRGVTVRQADFDKPESLTTAFAGAERLLLISTDAFDGAGGRVRQHRNAINAAVKAGVKQVLYTSFIRPEPGSPAAVAPDHFATEQALADSPLDWTSLRHSVYTESLLMSLPRAIATGQLVAAAGDGGASYVTREDCARAAAATLASQRSGRTFIDITGPAIVTHAELAQIASEIAGRTVTYVPVTPEALKAGMVAGGLPAPVADLVLSFDLAIAQGALAVASPAVKALTGQAPQSVPDFLVERRAMLLS